MLLVVSLGGWGPCERSAVARIRHDATRGVTRVPDVGRSPGHYTHAVTRWRPTALAAGWPAAAWPRLRCIIARESGGNPRAWNRGDPRGGSRGLVQINGVHNGWLIRARIIRTPSDLFHPYRNLAAARVVYRLQGWRAWASTTRGC